MFLSSTIHSPLRRSGKSPNDRKLVLGFGRDEPILAAKAASSGIIEEEFAVNQLRISLTVASFIAALFFGFSAVAQAGDDRLALKGYDPVAYFTEKRPMVGDPQYQHEWDGAIYRFASAKHLELFKVEPDRYLPQYNNWCAASVAKGVKVHGNPEYWLVVDGRLYLFGKPFGPGLMRGDPNAITSAAEKNWKNVSQLPNPPRE